MAAGIPAVTVQLDSEYAAISFESDDVYQLQGRSGTVTSGSGRREVTVEEWERTEAKRAEHEQKYTASDGTVSPFLFIGDDDFTEPWVACLDQTGYLEPNVPADPGDELKQKQLWARASAEWAGCARDNGFPTTKDPTAPVADNYETTPTAVLPSTIQPDELRTLLEVCPNFDPDGDQEITEDEAEAIGGYFGTVDPVIGFDLPGYDGGSSPGSGLVDEAVAARLAELQRVLNEALAEFYARTVQQG
ncbi:MAG: hypothetical protein LBO20_08235 [Bifidobacteriaceae bacterium]|nr:hypothetical protein [Bifidobacteriaceae bacterium]